MNYLRAARDFLSRRVENSVVDEVICRELMQMLMDVDRLATERSARVLLHMSGLDQPICEKISELIMLRGGYVTPVDPEDPPPSSIVDYIQVRLVEAEQPEEVNHPTHYNLHPSGVECIDIVEEFNFNVGNAIKYVWRAGLKDPEAPAVDLKKAAWYLNREIDRLERTNGQPER